MTFSTELLIALLDWPELCLPLTQMSGEFLDLGDEDRRAVSLPDSDQGWNDEKILYGFKSLKV